MRVTSDQSDQPRSEYPAPSTARMLCSARLRMGEQMRRPDLSRRRRLMAVIALATTAVAALAGGGTAGASATHHGFRQTNLVSDIPGEAQLTDPNLVNPWGLAAGPTTPLWAADNGGNVATIYPGSVGSTPISQVPLVVSIPHGAPTGQVFNPTNGFKLRV